MKNFNARAAERICPNSSGFNTSRVLPIGFSSLLPEGVLNGTCQFQNYLRIWAGRAEIAANRAALFASGCGDLPFGGMNFRLGYDRPVGKGVYAIDDFPDDDFLWRIEWIGGVGYNANVPSEPRIDVCLAQLPTGERNPLSARSRSAQTKKTVKIGVGLLPYIAIASVWQRRRPVATDLARYRHRMQIDVTSCRMVALGEVTRSANAIPRSSYLFGASWQHVRK